MKRLGILAVLLLVARSAIAADVCPAISGVKNWWCDLTISVTGTPVVIQSGNVGQSGTFRQYVQIQNNSDVTDATSTAACVVCFAADKRNVSCSASNGGTYLRPGQILYRTAAGMYGNGQLNSMYFNEQISAVAVGGTCTLSVSIDG